MCAREGVVTVFRDGFPETQILEETPLRSLPLLHVESIRLQDENECPEGVCRRRPPEVGDVNYLSIEEERRLGVLPKVLAADWCGEFEPKSPA